MLLFLFFSLILKVRSDCSPPEFLMYIYDSDCSTLPTFPKDQVCEPIGCTQCGTPSQTASALCLPQGTWEYTDHTGCIACCQPDVPPYDTFYPQNIDFTESCSPYTALDTTCTLDQCVSGFCGYPSGTVYCSDTGYDTPTITEGCIECFCEIDDIPANSENIQWDCSSIQVGSSCETVSCTQSYLCGTPDASILCTKVSENPIWGTAEITEGCHTCRTCSQPSISGYEFNTCPTSHDATCIPQSCDTGSGYCCSPEGNIRCVDGSWDVSNLNGCSIPNSCETLPNFGAAAIPNARCNIAPVLPAIHGSSCSVVCQQMYCGSPTITDVVTCNLGTWDFSSVNPEVCIQNCLDPCAQSPTLPGYLFSNECYQYCEPLSCDTDYCGDATGTNTCWDLEWVPTVEGCSRCGGDEFPVIAVVGGSLGGLVGISIFTLVFIKYRQRNRGQSSNTFQMNTTKPKKLPPATRAASKSPKRDRSDSPRRFRSSSPKPRVSEREREIKKKEIAERKNAIRQKRAQSPG